MLKFGGITCTDTPLFAGSQFALPQIRGLTPRIKIKEIWTFQKKFYNILHASCRSSVSGHATLRDFPLQPHTFSRILLAACFTKVIFNFHHFVVDYKGFKHKNIKLHCYKEEC